MCAHAHMDSSKQVYAHTEKQAAHLRATNDLLFTNWWEECCLLSGYHGVTQERNIPIRTPSMMDEKLSTKY